MVKIIHRNILFSIAFLLLIPFFVQAHPGRTASDGCHYCRTNCDRWGVAWNERHCHSNYVAPVSTPRPTPKITSKPSPKISPNPNPKATTKPTIINTSTPQVVQPSNVPKKEQDNRIKKFFRWLF